MPSLLLLGLLGLCCAQPKFHVIRQWKYLNFTWPSEEVYRAYESGGLYVPENNVVSGVKYFEGFFYLTLPRMRAGVPATLARVRAGPPGDAAPPLEPYPSWGMQGADCDGLQSVQNVEVDARGRMWVLDGGRAETLAGGAGRCPPKVLVFDVRSNRSRAFYSFPEEVASRNGSFLYDLVVDDTDGGYAYITDNSAHDPGIIVFSLKDTTSWKVRHPRSMTADPSAAAFTVNGVSVTAPINVAGIALGPKVHTSDSRVVVNEDREVYFGPLSSLRLYSINTTILRSRGLTERQYEAAVKEVGAKQSQTGAMVMDNRGILYFNLLGLNAVGRWDSRTPFETGQRLIVKDDRFMEWPSSFAFDLEGNLTILTNRLNRFIFGKVDLDEFNFRLITAHVGGRSYVYDEKFSYDTDRSGGRMLTEDSSTSSEPTPSSEVSSASSEPTPSPEPKTSSEVSRQSTSSFVPIENSNVTQSSAGNFVLSFVLLGFSFCVILV